MKKRITVLLLLVLPLWNQALLAHEGHGHDNPLSPGHYLGNPEHALPLALTVVAGLVVIGWGISRIKFARSTRRKH